MRVTIFVTAATMLVRPFYIHITLTLSRTHEILLQHGKRNRLTQITTWLIYSKRSCKSLKLCEVRTRLYIYILLSILKVWALSSPSGTVYQHCLRPDLPCLLRCILLCYCSTKIIITAYLLLLFSK